MAPWWLSSSEDEAPSAQYEEEAAELGEGEDEIRMEARGGGGNGDQAGSGDARADDGGSGAAAETSDDGPGEGDAAETKSRRRRRRRRRPAAKDDRSQGDDRKSEPPPADAPPPPRPEAESAEPAPETPVWKAPARGSARYAPPEEASMSDERKIAMFCDLENVALGVRASEVKELDVNLILERLLEKGKIIVKKAYADWERYGDYKRPFHEAAVELIDIPQKFYSGKNSADIKMVVDAMDLCYSKEHLDTFAIISGDSDFSPLVSKLKENNKYVIGFGVRNSSSNLLIDNCDEFIFYEDVWRVAHRGPRLDHLSAKDAEVFGLMSDAILALVRDNKEIVWGSMVKQTMQRKRPSFNESQYGYGSFSELLEDAERKRVVRLERDERSGNYVVIGFAQRS